MSERRGRYLALARAAPVGESAESEGGAGGILDVRLSGPPELVAAAVAALRLVLAVADVSRPYTNRRTSADVRVRRYPRATGLGPEAARFLARRETQ